MSVVESSTTAIPSPPGAILRAAREQAGIALETVAQGTLIPLYRLRALENDDYERVGVATFVQGYVRAYAKFLGMDATPLLRELEPALPKAEFVPMQPDPSVALALHVQKRPRSFFWPVVIAAVMLLGAIALIGLNTVLIPNEDVPDEDAPSAAESRTSNAAPHATSGRSLPLAIPVTEDVEQVLAAEDPLVAESDPLSRLATEDSLADSDFALTQPPLSAQTAAPPEAVPVTETESLAGDTDHDELVLEFSGDCWVEVTDAAGKALIARLATSGDNLQLFGRGPFEVVLGNAPVAKVTINGEAVDVAPPAGRKFKRLTVGES